MSLTRRPTMAMAKSTAAAPTQAAPATPSDENAPERPRRGAPSMKRATPRLAPELMPRTYGPANGLRNRVCISSPLTPSAAPARRATTAFTRRMSTTMRAVVFGTSPPVSAAKTSPRGTGAPPTVISKARKSSVTAPRIMKISAFGRLIADFRSRRKAR